MSITKNEYKECLKKEIANGLIKRTIRIRCNNSSKSVYYIRKAQYYAGKDKIHQIIAKYYLYKLGKLYGIFIGANSYIGLGLRLPHPNGIIIGEAVRIGQNASIYQQTTIGSSHIGDVKRGLQPQIGNNCVFFAGSKIIGNIKVADGTIVGANAVLTKDTEEKSTYVGIPAKKVSK